LANTKHHRRGRVQLFFCPSFWRRENESYPLGGEKYPLGGEKYPLGGEKYPSIENGKLVMSTSGLCVFSVFDDSICGQWRDGLRHFPPFEEERGLVADGRIILSEEDTFIRGG